MPAQDPLGIPHLNLTAVLPELELVVFGLLILLASVLHRGHRKSLITGLALAGLIVSLYSSLMAWDQAPVVFDLKNPDLLRQDRLSIFFHVLLFSAAFLSLLMAGRPSGDAQQLRGEFYALVLFAVAGMQILVSTSDLLILFLGLELSSIALYVLAGSSRNNPFSIEASLKYFLLGSFGAAFLLFGIALVYGATGSTAIVPPYSALIAPSIVPGFGVIPLAAIGWGLIFAGLAFKIALVPFHLWTPDVYEGAPTSVTAFMSVGTKAAVFAVLVRLSRVGLFETEQWSTLLATLAVLTMTVGNLAALHQSSLKRMLACSSIAHAGYLALGLLARGSQGEQAILFYLFAYAAMNLGAFAFTTYVGEYDDANPTHEDYRGLGFRHPFPAGAMALCMLSLTGIPPMAGFFGKLVLFRAVVDAGDTPLVVVALLNSVVAAYYYLRVIVMLYMDTGDEKSTGLTPGKPVGSIGPLVVAGVCAALILLAGVFPGAMLAWIGQCQ